MTPEGWTILALIVLPVLAVISVGILARAYVDGGGSNWGWWLVVLVLSSGAWFFFFSESP
jgi:hypothetical protein